MAQNKTGAESARFLSAWCDDQPIGQLAPPLTRALRSCQFTVTTSQLTMGRSSSPN
jgi:hypothetical protein